MSQDNDTATSLHALVIYSPVDRVFFDKQGMIVDGPDLTYAEWEAVCKGLTNVHRKYFMMFLWSWGDMLAYGEAKHGQKYSQAINDTDLALQTLANYTWLAKATPRELRGLQNLGQSHYERVVKIKDYKTKRDLLELASKESWPAKTTLAKAVTALLGSRKDNNQQNTPPPGSHQDELDLASRRQYMLEQQNVQLQLEQEMLHVQIGQAKELLQPVLLDQVSESDRILNVEKAMGILKAEPNILFSYLLTTRLTASFRLFPKAIHQPFAIIACHLVSDQVIITILLNSE